MWASSRLYPPFPRPFWVVLGALQRATGDSSSYTELECAEWELYVVIQSAVKPFMHPEVWVAGLFPEKVNASTATRSCSVHSRPDPPQTPGDAEITPLQRISTDLTCVHSLGACLGADFPVKSSRPYQTPHPIPYRGPPRCRTAFWSGWAN